MATSPRALGRGLTGRLFDFAMLAIVIAAGAIFGSFYEVTGPTIWAPRFALGVLVLGFLSTFVTRTRRSASRELADLRVAP